MTSHFIKANFWYVSAAPSSNFGTSGTTSNWHPLFRYPQLSTKEKIAPGIYVQERIFRHNYNIAIFLSSYHFCRREFLNSERLLWSQVIRK